MEYRVFPTAEEQLAKQTSDPAMVRALVYGLAGGLVGAAIWYAIVAVTKWELGLVAVVVGYLVGTGVVLGSGGKHGPRLQVLSVVITLAAMTVAEYLIVRQFAVSYIETTYGRDAAATVPVLLPLDMAWDFITAGIQDNPMTLLFWGIALWTAFRVPRLLPVTRVATATQAPTTR